MASLRTARTMAAGLSLLLLVLAAAPAAAEPPASGERTVTVTAADRTFDAVVHLPPTDATWDGTSPLPGGPWPVVIFGHGYQSPVDQYRTLLAAVAAAGYLVIAPTSGGELFPSHAAFADDLGRVIDWMTAENDRTGGWLEGAVDLDRIAASGHSMGGGAATLAVASDARFRTLATLAAAETRPSAVAAAAGISVPTLVVGGELDTIAPVASNQRPMFAAITDAPAALRVITGGSHCGFIDQAGGGLRDVLFGVVCDTATIPRETQQAIAARLLIDWLDATLLGDTAAKERAWDAAASDGTTLETRRP